MDLVEAYSQTVLHHVELVPDLQQLYNCIASQWKKDVNKSLPALVHEYSNVLRDFDFAGDGIVSNMWATKIEPMIGDTKKVFVLLRDGGHINMGYMATNRIIVDIEIGGCVIEKDVVLEPHVHHLALFGKYAIPYLHYHEHKLICDRTKNNEMIDDVEVYALSSRVSAKCTKMLNETLLMREEGYIITKGCFIESIQKYHQILPPIT